MKSGMESLINCVRVFAQANYETDGWDYVVEAYEDKDIEELISKAEATTPETAVLAVWAEVKMLDDVRKDVQSTVW